MIRRTVKFSLWGIGGLFVIILLCAALLLWRLAAAPLQLAFLIPYLERALSDPISGHHTDIRDTVLVWNKETRELDILVRQVRVVDANGATLAAFPSIAVTLSLQALLHRTVAATVIHIEGAQVNLIHQTDGSFELGTGARQPTSQAAEEAPSNNLQDLTQLLLGLVIQLMSAPDPSRPLAYLRQIHIVGGVLTVYDESLGVTWRATKTDMSIRREGDSLVALAHVTVDANGSPGQVDAEMSYHPSTSLLDLVVGLANINPSAMAPLTSAMPEFVGLDMPLSGKINVSLDLHGRLHKMRFQITGEAGRLSHPDLLPVPLPILNIMALGRLDQDSNTFHLDEATIRLGSAASKAAIIKLGASARREAGTTEVKGFVVLKNVQMAALKDYTPPEVRDRLPTPLFDLLALGSIKQASSQFELLLPEGNLDALSVKTLKGALHYHLSLQHADASLDTKWDYQAASQQVVVDVSFTGLRPAGLAPALPALSTLAGFDVPVDGHFNLVFGAHGRLQNADFNISARAGKLSLPDVLPAPLAIAWIALRGRLAGQQETLRIDDIVFDMGDGNGNGPVIAGNFKAQRLGQRMTADGHLTLQRLPIAELNNYWPRGVSDNARVWVTTNLVNGVIDQVGIDLKLSRPAGNAATVNVDHLDGTMQFRDIEVHYVRPLPPITDVDGTARFNQQGLQIKIASGKGPGLRLTGGDVRITGFDTGREAIAVQVGVETSLRDTLTLLDGPELNLISGLGIDPSKTGGQANLQAEFAFSLRGDIQIDKVDIKVQGELKDVVLRNLFLGHDAIQGDLHLDLDNDGMLVQGTTRFAGLPLSINWREAFTKQAVWKTEIKAIAPRIGQADLLRLGVALPIPMDGSFATTLTAKIDQYGKHVVQAEMDVQKAELSIPLLGWRKAAGESGSVRGTLRVDSKQGLAEGKFSIDVGSLSTRGSLQIEPAQGTLTHLDLDDLIIAKTHLSGVTLRRHNGNIDVVIGEGVVDVQALLQSQSAGRSRQKDAATGKPPTAAQQRGEVGVATQYHLHAPALRRVYFGADRYLEDVAVELRHDEKGWALIDLSARIPDSLVRYLPAEKKSSDNEGLPPRPRRLTVTYQPDSQDVYTLSAQTSDVGSTLRALNLHDGITGGNLKIEGRRAGSQPDSPLKAAFEVKNFVAKEMPMVARILAAASFGGLLDSLNNDGLKFSRLFGDLVLHDDVITIELLRAHGGALGITGVGKIDTGAGILDVKGTVVPARMLNTLPGKIPLLGNLLVGGKGQGVVAVNYRLHGELANPKVSVNPASLLTPGFLRKVFGLFNSSVGGDAVK
ncbi:MAG: AsmA-like C-terminal domain-containing protein [bacterium]|nr:AsmA-like C-terminal domain-containing protein [bacterium]